MKKAKILFFTLLFFSFYTLHLCATANIDSDLNLGFYKSLGSATAKAFGLPVDEVAQVASDFGSYNYKDAFLTIAKYAKDEVLGMLPVYGPAKFAKDMVDAFGNVLYTYLGNEVVKIAWQKFLQLNEEDKENWLNGGYEPTIDELHGIRLVDKNKMRLMFKKAYENYKIKQEHSKKLFEIISKVTKLIKYAKTKSAPDLYNHSDGDTIKIQDPIEVWRSNNNYFRITLILPDGKASIKIFKLNTDPKKDPTFSFKLSDFNINWSNYFSQYPGGVPIKLKITGAVYDSSGVMKLIMKDLVTPGENIINVPNYPLSEDAEFNLKVINYSIACNGKVKGMIYIDYVYNIGGNITSGSGPIFDKPIIASLGYKCDTKNKIAYLITEDGGSLPGKCDENGTGVFSGPYDKQGRITLYIHVSCNPELNLRITSTGALTYSDYMVNKDGSTTPVKYTFQNLRGTFKPVE